jgi:hypothetical protein
MEEWGARGAKMRKDGRSWVREEEADRNKQGKNNFQANMGKREV